VSRDEVHPTNPQEEMPNPTPEDMKDPTFEAIWQAVKTWDVSCPEYYSGYCGMNGSHVKIIYDAVKNVRTKGLDEGWFDQMITRSTESQNSPITVKDRDGSDLQVKITNAVIEYMVANRFMILKAGRDTFKQFLYLCSSGQDLAALKLIYQKMDTSILVNMYADNAVKLAEIYKQDQETKAFWIQMATTLGGKIISLALGSII